MKAIQINGQMEKNSCLIDKEMYWKIQPDSDSTVNCDN